MKTETKKEMHELQIFDFKGHPVRVELIDNKPWFVAVDVCKILGLTHTTRAISRLNKDDCTKSTVVDSKGRNQETHIINEPGLWKLVLRSNKPAADKFKNWIIENILTKQTKETAR